MILNASYVCLHAFSLRRESPDPDPGRRTPHFWGGSVTGAYGGGQYPWPKGREKCWNSTLDGRLEAVVARIHLEAVAASIQLETAVMATSKPSRLWETLPMTSQVLDLFENPISWKFDKRMSKNLNSELKKEENYTCDLSKCGVEGSSGALWRGPYGRGMQTAWITLIIYYQIEHIQDSYVQYP
jgi:hypothetical protein